MNSYDFFVEYKTGNNREIFKKINQIYKSFVKLKCGYVIDKTTELENYKNFIKRNKTYSIGNINQISQISGIFSDSKNLKKHIQKLPKYSFAMWFKFKLKSPYFSKDDDEFYIIQNPILKEKVFKVPMIRGSGWKGALLKSAIEMLKETNDSHILGSIFRIFGVGDKEYRELFDNNDKVIKEKLKIFLALEMGYSPNESIDSQIKKYFETKAKKGRAVFYPTYFDSLSLEIINPHDRRKRAGKNPIHYEVVPKNTEAIFQLIYIPFDGILQKEEDLKEEVEKDLNVLCNTLKKLSEKGIGAKTKLGWGRFEITDKKVCIDENIEISEGWEKCQ